MLRLRPLARLSRSIGTSSVALPQNNFAANGFLAATPHGPLLEAILPFVRWSPGMISRTEISLQGPDDLKLMLLCAEPGSGMMMHEHADAGNGSNECVLRVLRGEMTTSEIGYDLCLHSEQTVKEGDSAVINSGVGVHKLMNRGIEGAIALHVYAPQLTKRLNSTVDNSLMFSPL
jgi:hypothetical protein